MQNVDELGRVKVTKGVNNFYIQGDYRLTWVFDKSYLNQGDSKIIIEGLYYSEPCEETGKRETYRVHILGMQFCDTDQYGGKATTEDVEKVINQFGFTLVD